jgi:cytochrome P450
MERKRVAGPRQVPGRAGGAGVLARIEGQIAFSTVLRRLPKLRHEVRPLVWRERLGMRGLKALPITF